MGFFRRFFRTKQVIEQELKVAIRSGVLPVQVVSVGEALDCWKAHAEQFGKTNLWPLLIGPIEQINERFQSDPDDLDQIDEVLAASKSISGGDACRNRWLSRFDDERELKDLSQEVELEFDSRDLKLPRTTRFSATILSGFRKEVPENVGLALIPCAAPYELLANWPFGDWNDCPTDAEHIAIHRDWYNGIGAVPIGIQPDVIELYLPSPIMDSEVAARLAREMYFYAPDIVEQGTETVKALAQEILGSSILYFWWD